MLFNSYVFLLLFLPITLLVFFLAGKQSKELAMLWLVVCSLFFYGWWNPGLLSIIIASIAANYTISQFIGINNARFSYVSLCVGIALNLILLGYFKYANFFVENINQLLGSSFHLNKVILPLAISFFTFQQITYLIDTYRKDTEEHNFLHYCLFVTFFPQLIAGPIVHHKEVLSQFTRNLFYKPESWNVVLGLTIFSIGLFKKVILADGVSVYSTAMFDVAGQGVLLSATEYWIGAIAYSVQLYFDFSGYSDMAIGLGLLFGIKLPVNFNSPYKATSIIDFWTRWHITLSRFLKDYLYVPLGGNRYGSFRKYRNLMLTMLLGGLWHGAGWTFIIWGGLQGIYLIVNHSWRYLKAKIKYDPIAFKRTREVFSLLITFLAVILGWVVFRSENIETASSILSGMCGMVDGSSQGLFKLPGAGLVVLLLLSIALFMPNTQQFVGYVRNKNDDSNWNSNKIHWTPSLLWGGCTGLMLSVSILFLARESEFLYFQF